MTHSLLNYFLNLASFPPQFLTVRTENLVFHVMEIIHAKDFHLAAQFTSPFTLLRIEALLQEGCNKGMELKVDRFEIMFLDDFHKIKLNQFREENRRLYLTRSMAGGAVLRGLDVHLWTNTLTRDLHQTKLTQRKYVVLGLIH